MVDNITQALSLGDLISSGPSFELSAQQRLASWNPSGAFSASSEGFGVLERYRRQFDNSVVVPVV
jgi:hypothetical protein